MMKLFEKRAGKKTRGQTMVEFALILPVLLMTMYGVMEFGRLLFIYITTTSAAREATRYASAVEDVGGVERYRDCTGIREAARRVDVLGAIQSINITYYTNYGGGASQVYQGSCPEGGVGPGLGLGDQVVVEVIGNFQPIVPMVPININRIEAESSRTIIKDVPVGVLVPPVVSGETTMLPPFVSFESYYTVKHENDPLVNPPNFHRIKILITDEDGDPMDPVGNVTVTYRISGLSEARAGSDYNILTSNPITISATEGYIDVEIINDSLYEYYERVIFYIESVSGEDPDNPPNMVSPNVHVLYILDDDRIPPYVEFVEAASDVSEVGSPNHPIELRLVNELGVEIITGRDTYVPVNIVSGTAIQGWDYHLQTETVTIPAGAYRAPLIVNILDDSVREGDKYVVFQLMEPLINGILDPDGQNEHILTILDNEPEGHERNCAYYGISDWTFSNGTRIGTVNLSNSDPLLAPVYITGISLEWVSNTPRLESIHFPTGTQIWPATGTRSEPSRFEYTWENLALHRQLRQATKQLAFNMSSNNPGVREITVTLDNGCPPLVLRP
jgi:hypothetical protein